MDIPNRFQDRFETGEVLVKRPACIVYKGSDSKLDGMEIAIKVYLDKPDGRDNFVEEFQEEVNQLRQAAHHALVPIVAGGEEDGWLYIVMELMKGKTLREHFKDEGNFPVDEATEYISELGDAVSELHHKDLVHAHIDSRAVLFKDGQPRLAGYYPRAIDSLQKHTTSAGRMIVEPAYVAPEQVQSPAGIDHRVDVYSLATVYYEMLTGQRPFSADNPLQLAMMRLSEPPPSPAKLNKNISPLIDAAVVKGLARDPEARFQSVQDFLDAVTGGKKEPVNPLAGSQANGGSAERPQRLATETIATGMSTEAIQHILAAHDAKKSGAAPEPEEKKAPPADEAQSLAAVHTVVGVHVDEVYKGSFVFLDGEKRGEEYNLDKEQTIIGRDASCDFVISDKDIPLRYAIVVRRNMDYSIGPLSATPLVLNGEEEQDAEEITLKRGDVLSAGDLRLRYVAPGEVFTLEKDVADRAIDRPKSKFSRMLGLGAVGLIAVCVLFFVILGEKRSLERDARKRSLASAKVKREMLITKLVREGDEFFKEGALTAPVGASARDRFRDVLKLDPDNGYAKRRLAQIKDRASEMAKTERRRGAVRQRVVGLMKQGDRLMREKSYISPPGQNARETFQEVLEIDPENEVAKERLKEIGEVLRKLLGQVGELLAQAKAYIDLGQYAAPPGENAYELLKQILQIDPQNDEARSTLYDIAAYNVYLGDMSKRKADYRGMKKHYLTARALGVDPQFIKRRLKGAKLIKRSRSSVIIYSKKKDKKKKKTNSKFLPIGELETRIANYELKGSMDADMDGPTVIELDGTE